MTYTYSQLGHYGRLGNQMFQIAGTYGTAVSKSDTCVFPRWAYEQYFNWPSEYFSDSVEPDAIDLYPDYLQRVRLFSDVKESIFRRFSPSPEAEERLQEVYGDIIQNEFAALHVRRGDYVNLPNHHPVVSLDYYERVLDLVPSELNVVVVSDALDWCKKQRLFKEAHFAQAHPVALESEVLDMLLLSRSSLIGIANSTFSWWGGWLAWMSGAKVYYPSRWYGPELSHIQWESDMIDQSWGKVSV